MGNGNLLIALHAHLPYIRHPEHEFFLEENWLHETVVDCYLPLLCMLMNLHEERVSYGIAISLSPTLLVMLGDPLLRERTRRHMERLIELSESHLSHMGNDSLDGKLAAMYGSRYRKMLAFYNDTLKSDITKAFCELADTGKMELFTSSATHTFLPNLMPVPTAVSAQIEGGARIFHRHTGRRPGGIWLPECGYAPGIDAHLEASGLGYCFVETHGILHATPRVEHGIYRPVMTGAGSVAFGRDNFCADRVWSAESGYPANPVYRDFHSDIGLTPGLLHVEEHLGSFLHEGVQGFTGLKHKRIDTGEDKAHYEPEAARETARAHARDFVASIHAHTEVINNRYGFTPLITAPYDAELFGHWWYEGIDWLEDVLRICAESKIVNTVTPSRYITEHAASIAKAEPSLSSWGEGGYSSIWTDTDSGESTVWAQMASRRLTVLARGKPLKRMARQAADQAVRELMLASSSDWLFMINKHSHVQYAQGRIKAHMKAFESLMKMAEGGHVSAKKITMLASKTPGFEEIDLELFR